MLELTTSFVGLELARVPHRSLHRDQRWRRPDHAEPLGAIEVARRGLRDCDREAIERMFEAVENRLLHAPTMRLRKAAVERESSETALDELTLALSELFGLDDRQSLPKVSEFPPKESASGPREAEPVSMRAVVHFDTPAGTYQSVIMRELPQAF